MERKYLLLLAAGLIISAAVFAAAGTEYVDVPVVVQTTLKSGSEQIFAGCFSFRAG